LSAFPPIADLQRGAYAAMLHRRVDLYETYRSFQTTYQELREQFTTLRKLYYLIECAWYQKRIRWTRRAAAALGDTSHGICPPCATALFSQMQAMKHAPACLVTLNAAWEPLSAVLRV
jgi:hypothetical protein